MSDQKTAAPAGNDAIEKLSSKDLAALIIDALLRAEIVQQHDVKRSMSIALEEIEARKALGDY